MKRVARAALFFMPPKTIPKAKKSAFQSGENGKRNDP